MNFEVGETVIVKLPADKEKGFKAEKFHLEIYRMRKICGKDCVEVYELMGKEEIGKFRTVLKEHCEKIIERKKR